MMFPGIGGAAGGAYQSSAAADARQDAESAFKFSGVFGDKNVGAGSGSGFSPLMVGIIGAVVLAAFFIWRKFK